MNVMINASNYNNEYVYITEPMQNVVIKNSLFYRIIYSTNIVTLNCLYILYKPKAKEALTESDKLEIYENNILIKGIEQQILSMVRNTKNKMFRIAELIDSGVDKASHCAIKISGIWETDINCGLTYKIIY